MSNAYLQAHCINNSNINSSSENTTNSTSEIYWTLSEQPLNDSSKIVISEGLQFFIYNSAFSTITVGFSLLTIYTSVILIIGKFIRDFFYGYIELLFLI